MGRRARTADRQTRHGASGGTPTARTWLPLVALAITGCKPPTPAAPAGPVASTGAAAGYVDDQRCTTCHREIAESFDAVAMSKSLYRHTPETTVEDFENGRVYHELTDRHYEMSQRDGVMYVARYQLDAGGERFNEFEAAADWVIGSGNHVRSYMFRNDAGELYQMPISWYARPGKWAMSPGFHVVGQNDFKRQITRECMFCHNAYPDVAAGSDRLGEHDAFPRKLPMGIGCQRCHGPGADHVRIASDPDASDAAVLASVVNPSRLEPSLRDDVCLQCHLQTSTRLTSLMRRFGRNDYAYRPGEPLSDYLIHFEIEAEGHEPATRFEINHHPYRLFQSACYVQSDGAMSCMTCHDPHRTVPGAERAVFYRDRCLTCHQLDDCDIEQMQTLAAETSIAADDCVACHMGERHPTDVTQVVMTDHLIQRRPPPLVPVPVETENEPMGHSVVRHYDVAAGAADPLGETYRAVTLARSLRADKPALRDAVRQSPEIADLYWYLAREELHDRAYAEAERLFRKALELVKDQAWPHLGLGKALQRQGRDDEAMVPLVRARELAPRDPEVRLALGRSARGLGRLDDARHHLDQAVRLRPNYSEAYYELGSLEASRGRLDDAERLLRQALAIDTANSRTATDLGAVLLARGKFAEASRYWRHAASVDPTNTDVREWLARLHLTCPDAALRSPARGLAFAREAFDIAPDSPTTATTLALAQLLNDRYAEAITAADAALDNGGAEPNPLLITAVALSRLERGEDAAGVYVRARAAVAADPSADAVRMLLLRLAESELR